MKQTRLFVLLLIYCFALAIQAQQCEHVVQRGEDFATIAKKYGITEQELMDANPTSKQCYAGRKLIIPKHGVPVVRRSVTPKPLDIKLLSSDDDILTKSSATTYQVGQALWRKGKYDEAVTYLEKAVENGEPRAYYPLGECYAQKDAKCHNETKAVECFQKAVEKVKNKYDESYWQSCGNMAIRYQQGNGVNRNLAKAKEYTEEFQRYTDPDGRENASKLMRSILAEEHAIAEKELAEKRAIAAQRLAEKREKARQNAEMARNQQTSQKSLATTSNRKASSNSSSNNSVPFPGYTRVAGGLPQVGETKYWNKWNSLGYCSIRCTQDNDGTTTYYVYPDLIDFKYPTSFFKYKGQRDGWIVLQRVHKTFKMNINMNMNMMTPFANTYQPIQWFWIEVPGEVLVSIDGNRVQARNGTCYDTPVDKATVDLLNKKYNEFVASGVAAGIIKLDTGESEVERQLKQDIEELDRKQAERQRKEIDLYEKRVELGRGHRTTRYKYTNVESTPTVWCNICNRFDKPHTHPVNDGRH